MIQNKDAMTLTQGNPPKLWFEQILFEQTEGKDPPTFIDKDSIKQLNYMGIKKQNIQQKVPLRIDKRDC